MRIWLITSSYPRTPKESVNAGVLARDLALALAQAGHEVTVVTPQKPGGIELDDNLLGLPLPWFRPTTAMADLSSRVPLDLLRILSLLVFARITLRRALRRNSPDAIVALWALPSGIFARWISRWTGAPYAVWLLGSDVWKAPSYPLGVSWLRKVLADSNAAYADGRELAAEATRLTGMPVEVLASVRKLPAPPSILPDAVDLLFIGRYHPNKGPDLLIEAFAKVRLVRPGAKLRLHGEGALRSELQSRIDRLELQSSVVLGGALSAAEVAGAMASAKVLAVPSRIESVPLILSDAMQARLPVVATSVGDIPEFVRSNNLGMTVPPNDPDALAAGLLAMLDTPVVVGGPHVSLSTPESIAKVLLAKLNSGHHCFAALRP